MNDENAITLEDFGVELEDLRAAEQWKEEKETKDGTIIDVTKSIKSFLKLKKYSWTVGERNIF